MFRILPKRMAFLTRRHRYLLLQWIVIVLSTLPAPVNSNGISATVTAIPQVTRPNSWVKLVCTFNLTDKDTSIVYWSDKNGDTLYVFEKGETPELQYGPLYKSPWASGRIENVTRHTGNHSLMLFVDGCAKSPYTCYIWKDAIELAKPLFVEIKHIPGPVFTIQGEQVNEIKIVENGTHILSCAIHETTAAHNLTMNVEINGVNQKDTSPRAGNYNITKCTYSSKLKKDYELLDSDKVQVQCIAKYATGEQLITTTRSPGMGGLTDLMLPPWLIIVIVIIIFLILIVIIITVIVMVVKKKKATNRDGYEQAETAALTETNDSFPPVKISTYEDDKKEEKG